MARPALNPLALTAVSIAAIGCVTSGAPAQAATITYDFTVDITTGNTVGTYTGNFSFDLDPNTNSLQPCSPNSDLLCAFADRHGVKITFNFPGHPDNRPYNETDDLDNGLGAFPAVYFTQQNTLVGLGLIVAPPKSNLSFALLGTEFYQGFAGYPDPATQANKVGSITYRLRQTPGPGPGPGDDRCERDPDSCNPAAVPEPSAVAGSAIAIGVFGSWRFWRRRRMDSF